MFNTVVTADMAVAVKGNPLALTLTRIAGRALEGPTIAVACNFYGCLSLTVTEIDFGEGEGSLNDSIGVERDLNAQTVVFNLLANFAVKICFKRTPFLARRVV